MRQSALFYSLQKYDTLSAPMDNKDEYQAEIFSNRLKRKYRELRKWARKNRVSCFRLYDRDIPEIPVSLDVYEFLPEKITNPLECARFLSEQNARISANDRSFEKEIAARMYAVLYLYERPYEKPQEEEERWLSLMAEKAASVLHIALQHIIIKERRIQKGLSQYTKNEESAAAIKGTVQEQGQLFRINLSTYLDTGLFFDHRPLRAHIRDIAGKKSVLNLFCYTSSFSVYAAQGNARRIESADLSNTYLAWSKENMELNGFTDKNKYCYTKSDCIRLLDEKRASTNPDDRYDIIILDPPTFSNSKSTKTILDINKQWQELVNSCLSILTPGGTVFFSTNSAHLSFNPVLITSRNPGVEISDITLKSIPKDFEGTKCHRTWKLSLLR